MFVNSSTSQVSHDTLIDSLTSITQDEYLISKEVNYITVDYHQDEFFKKHYDLEDQQYLYLFINNKIFKMENFDQIHQSDSLNSLTHDFIKKTIQDLVVQLEDQEHLD